MIELDENGQLTARFGKDPLTNQYLPQLPFDDLNMSFFGGSRAALITPPACGTYTTTSQLIPWSGGLTMESSSSFTVDQGCGTGEFASSFIAGTSDSQAGAYSPFSVTFSRHDGEQRLASKLRLCVGGHRDSVDEVSQEASVSRGRRVTRSRRL